MVNLTVVRGNTNGMTNRWRNVRYSFPVTNTTAGTHTFSGTSLGSRTPPPPNSDYNLGVSGTFNPTTGALTIGNPVTSVDSTGKDTNTYKFTFTGITMIPEPPSSTLALTGIAVAAGLWASSRRARGLRGA